MRNRAAAAAAAVAAAVVALGGCAADPDATPTADTPESPTPQVTVTVTATPTPSASRTAASQRTQEAAPSTSRKPTKTPDTAQKTKKAKKPAAPPKIITVPDAVGMNYQRAQDLWRKKGLVVLPAKDASGEDRLALLDSNWYVVSQKPAAGTRIKDGGFVRATILKYSD